MSTGTGIAHCYVHVPFCPTICPFCDFHVTRRRDDLVEAYLAELDREAAETADTFDAGPLLSLYLGGGTPTHLTDAELERLLASIRRRFDATRAEITLEAHPANVDRPRARRWRDLGVNRVSLGVQSTQDPVLRFLGRPHDAQTSLRALEDLRSVDDWVVSADVITAVAGQDVEADLVRVAAAGVDHLSAYTLTIEAGTPFARRGVAVDPDAEVAALRTAGAVLDAVGLPRYEVSNHARPGRECAHNLAYWKGRTWFGLGPAAAAQLPTGDPHRPRRRRTNPPLGRWLAGERGEDELLDPADIVREGMLTGLRLRRGVDLGELAQRAGGVDLGPLIDEPVAALVAEGLLERAGHRVRATGEGLLVLDAVAARFL